MAGPVDAALGSPSFGPLPGLAPAGEAELVSGQAADLHALYGGLQSGRLIIAGSPGSGKSGAAVLLVLAALRHREHVPAQERSEVPVPVLLTVQDWNPVRQSVAEWLAEKLQDTYLLFNTAAGAQTAAELLATGRIAVILDGLDEISPDLRPVALQALSQQATFRLVLLSRTSEMAVAAASQGVLQGAAVIELNPVDSDAAASYLEQIQLDPPPGGWQELTERVRTDPGSPLSRALGTPLALTLVRDTYQAGDSIRELLDFCDTLDGMSADWAAEAITDYLLDRVLAAAYTRRPGQPPLSYDLATARRSLTAIATWMNHHGTRDLNWWEIPKWTPWEARLFACAIVGVLTGGIGSGIGIGLSFGAVAGVFLGLVFGIISGAVFGLVFGGAAIGGSRPRVIGDLRLTKELARNNLVFGLVLGLIFGVAFGLLAGVKAGLEAGLVLGLLTGLVRGIRDLLSADPESSGSLSPATSWRRNRSYGLLFGGAVGLVAGLATAVPAGLAWGLSEGVASGVFIWLVAGPATALFSNAVYPVWLASMQLAIDWRTPIRLMSFLNDAHSRHVLRAVGSSYQFRHARLQDRLADYPRLGDMVEESLVLIEAVDAPDHPYVATALNTLVAILIKMEEHGQSAEARPLAERVLAITEAAHGPDHPDVATALNTLATILRDLGMHSNAKPLAKRAQAIRKAQTVVQRPPQPGASADDSI